MIFKIDKQRLSSNKNKFWEMLTEPVEYLGGVKPFYFHAHSSEQSCNRWSLLKGWKMPDGEAEQGRIQLASKASVSSI